MKRRPSKYLEQAAPILNKKERVRKSQHAPGKNIDVNQSSKPTIKAKPTKKLLTEAKRTNGLTPSAAKITHARKK